MGRQKRSANTYTKINTVFFRDANNIIMPYDSLVSPELEWLRNCKFDAEEKIDGTNMRIELSCTCTDANFDEIAWVLDIKGKTDNAQIPKELEAFMRGKYDVKKVCKALGLKEVMKADDEISIEKGFSKLNPETNTYEFDWDNVPIQYTIYGEGYGRKIQGCGSKYIKEGVNFIGFDVKIQVGGTSYWLLRENRDSVFKALNTPTCPYKGQFTIDEAIEYVRKGFKSEIAEDKEFLAEGLVLRSPHGLLDRRGNRIMFKVKTCDFVKYREKYGTDDKVEQTKNEHI